MSFPLLHPLPHFPWWRATMSPRYRAKVVPPCLTVHWMPLVLPRASVPFVSDESVLLSELRLASDGKVSLRGGILSLMRSRPFASSKLVILCCGEKPLMAVKTQEKGGEKNGSGAILKRGRPNDTQTGGGVTHLSARHQFWIVLHSISFFFKSGQRKESNELLVKWMLPLTMSMAKDFNYRNFYTQNWIKSS